MLNTEIQASIHDGPVLFLRGVADGEVTDEDPALTFGAGSWLLHQKAKTFKQDRFIFVWAGYHEDLHLPNKTASHCWQDVVLPILIVTLFTFFNIFYIQCKI